MCGGHRSWENDIAANVPGGGAPLMGTLCVPMQGNWRPKMPVKQSRNAFAALTSPVVSRPLLPVKQSRCSSTLTSACEIIVRLVSRPCAPGAGRAMLVCFCRPACNPISQPPRHSYILIFFNFWPLVRMIEYSPHTNTGSCNRLRRDACVGGNIYASLQGDLTIIATYIISFRGAEKAPLLSL